MSLSDLDLLDEEENTDFDDPGRQPEDEADKEADQPSTDEPEADPTDGKGEEAKDGADDEDLKLVELEFENETLKSQLAEMQQVKAFLDNAASNPEGALGALAQHLGKQPSAEQAQTGSGWKFASEYDDDSKKTFTDIQQAVSADIEAATAPLLNRIAALEQELGQVKPVLAKTIEKEESTAKESAAERRAGGVANLVIAMSPGRNNGWTPTKEQVVAYAKANPAVLDGATSAKEAAGKLLEGIRIRHLDDILSHKNTKPAQDKSNRPVVAKNDARGADSDSASRKAAIIARARDGF